MNRKKFLHQLIVKNIQASIFLLLLELISYPLNAQPRTMGFGSTGSPIRFPSYDTLHFISAEFLGRPTDQSITINLIPKESLEVYFEYGIDSNYANQTPIETTPAGVPLEIKLDNLLSNTRYYYRTRYREVGVGTFLIGPGRTFHTQRPRHQSFTFAVEADPHMESGQGDSVEVFELTLQNIAASNPDFMIDLGDNFMLDKWNVINEDTIRERMYQYRRWWDEICHSIPLFIVLGNHEGEQGWDFDTTPTCRPVLLTNARKLYYPNPVPDGFYTGDTIPEQIVGLREDYYAWEWGNCLFVALDPYWHTMIKPTSFESNWNWTLGRAQYDWLKWTLEQSRAKFKFVFIHHLVGGKIDATARGGIEYCHFYEWGGLRSDSTWGFDMERPGWGVPIHQLLIDNQVDIMFHGHDHFYAKQDTDDIVYQLVPQPGRKRWDSIPQQATQYGYLNGILIGPRGYLRVMVDDTSATVDYVRTFLPGETTTTRHNQEIAHSYTIVKGTKDVGVSLIVAPLTEIDSGQVITPACSVYNYGTTTETYLVRMKIGTLYEDTVRVVAHAPGTYKYIPFPTSWSATQLGVFPVTCSTELSKDMDETNDKKTDSVTVEPPPPTGWVAMTSIPAEPSTRKPKSGTCLVTYNGEIYLLKASNTQDFAKFTPNSMIGTWTVLDTIPKGDKLTGDGKKPKKGASMVVYIPTKDLFVLRGNNTPGFWKFHTDSTGGETLGWKKLVNIPTGLKNPKDASGMCVITKGGKDYIFTMKGSKTDEFYLYDISANSWTATATKPGSGTSTKVGYKKGSCLVYDGSQYVYILKGQYGDMFRYSVASDSFVELKRFDYKTFINRLGKKKKVSDGSGMVYYNDNLYILKGGNTLEFWHYNIVGDTYVQMDSLWDIPTGGGKRVKAGGGLTMIPSGTYTGFYSAKGANTQEFYYHKLPSIVTSLKSPKDIKVEGIMENKVAISKFQLTIIPNPATNLIVIRYSLPVPGPVTYKLYNVYGAIVKASSNLHPTKEGVFMLDAKTMPTGIYILRFNSGDIKVTRKIVLEK